MQVVFSRDLRTRREAEGEKGRGGIEGHLDVWAKNNRKENEAGKRVWVWKRKGRGRATVCIGELGWEKKEPLDAIVEG